MNSTAIQNTAVGAASSSPAINWEMVKRLILKDWYLQRIAIFCCIGGGFGSLAIIEFGGEVGLQLGIVLLITVLVASAAILATNTIVLERKEQTLPFVMSLPVSYREYTAAKILGMAMIFLIPWLLLTVGSFTIIAFSPRLPGLVPFTAIMAVEILVSTCLIAAVALITESQGWTITAIMVGNLGLNVFGYIVAHVPSIGRGMFVRTVAWTPVASGILAAEFAAIALLIAGTFFVQSRKKDFL